MRRVLLGLDPAKRNCGWAVCDLILGTPLLCGRADLDKLQKRNPGWALEEAYDAAFQEVHGILTMRDLSVEVCYIEKHFVGRSRKITLILAEAMGTCLMATHVWFPGAPRNRVVPQTWKRKLGLGHNATISQYQEKATQLGWKWENEDEAAAGCIASAGWLFNEEGSYE